jgi:Rrf2 family protein
MWDRSRHARRTRTKRDLEFAAGGAAVEADQAPTMKLSRTVSYAVRATLQLAQSDPDTPVPCSKLASEGGMPERFLLQILRILVTHGILRSTRGVEGGYALTKPADQISLLDVIEAIDGPLAGEVQPATPETAETADEKLQTALWQVTQTARHQLESIKLSQLLKPPELPPGLAPPEVPAQLDLPEPPEAS